MNWLFVKRKAGLNFNGFNTSIKIDKAKEMVCQAHPKNDYIFSFLMDPVHAPRIKKIDESINCSLQMRDRESSIEDNIQMSN